MERRRIRMDNFACDLYGSSTEGSLALRAPQLVKKSSKDPNRSMQPGNAGQRGARGASRKRSTREDVAVEPRNKKVTECDSEMSLKCNDADQMEVGDDLLPSKATSTLGCSLVATKERDTQTQFRSTLAVCERDAPIYVDSSSSDSDASTESTDAILDPFGLVGSGRWPTVRKVTVDDLPDELLETVLYRLPFMDLVGCMAVCKRWKVIISSSMFMPWKKEYYAVKLGATGRLQHLPAITSSVKFEARSEFLSWVIICARNYKYFELSSGRSLLNVTTALRQHPRYCCALGVLLSRFRDESSIFLDADKTVPNPWAVMASLVLLAKTTKDVKRILDILCTKQSSLSMPEVLDSFYFIASLLMYLYLTHGRGVWTSVHYRLYHCLYSYENMERSSIADFSSTLHSASHGQQSLLRYCSPQSDTFLTQEQKRIVSCDLKGIQVLKVVAFAGTGKTACLVEYAKLRPHMKFLYVVYNKSVADHAVKLFPGNVECRTGHSLAYSVVGTRYKWIGELKVFDVSQTLPKKKGVNHYTRSKMVVDTIKNFIASNSTCITTAHVPRYTFDTDGSASEVLHETKMAYAEDAEAYWLRMVDVNDFKVAMTHDGYMKLWQLEGGDINASGAVLRKLPYIDCIFIDEAQDMSHALADVLLKQSVPKVVVGDPHQQIYAFRGAVNVMDLFTSTRTLRLTRSFRFGPQIGLVAALLLDYLKSVRQHTLLGRDMDDCICSSCTFVGQVALIARTNCHLLVTAYQLCTRQPKSRIHLMGGKEGLGFSLIMDIYHLLTNKTENIAQIKSKLVKKFESMARFEKFVNTTNDAELLGKIKLVRMYHTRIPEVLLLLEQRHTNDLERADYVFTTAHKAKGLEFSTVILLEDFAALATIGGPNFDVMHRTDVSAIDQDEKNLLYVAATRAKKCLVINRSIYSVLKTFGGVLENPLCPRAPASLPVEHVPTVSDNEPHLPILFSTPVYLFDGTAVPGRQLDLGQFSDSACESWRTLLVCR